MKLAFITLALVILGVVALAEAEYTDADLAGWRLTERTLANEVLDNPNYDKEVRPPGIKNLNDPVKVRFTMHILSLGLCEKHQEVTVRGFMRQMWNDPRLKVKGVPGDKIIYKANDMFTDRRVWIPDTFIIEEGKGFVRSNELGTGRSFLRFSANGDVLSSMMMNVKAVCPMGDRNPVGTAVECIINMESYGLNSNEVLYEWKEEGVVSSVTVDAGKTVVGKGWRLENHSYVSTFQSLSTGNYTSARLTLNFKKYATPVHLPIEI